MKAQELFGKDYLFWSCGYCTKYENGIYYEEVCVSFTIASLSKNSIGYPHFLYYLNFMAGQRER